MTAAAAFFVLAVLMLCSVPSFTGHYFQPHTLAMTHLAALGWGTMMIFGASHQLIPVVAEAPLFSETLAKICYILLLPGVVLISVSFWSFSLGAGLQAGAFLVLASAVLYALNVWRTLRRAHKRSMAADCSLTASWWLVLTAALGTLLVFNLRYAFLPQEHVYYLKVHAHLGIAGWFLLLVMGVASRLIPMFLLSHREPGWELRLAYFAVNGALLAWLLMALALHTERWWPLPALGVLAGVAAFGRFIYRAWQGAIRRKLDAAMRLSLIGLGFMGLPFVLLGILAFLGTGGPAMTRFSLGYGVSIFAGFLTAIILGQTFKTLPFIVWMQRYKHRVGREKTPLPKDLYRERWVRYQLIAYLAGYTLLLGGILAGLPAVITAGCGGLLLAAAWYNASVWKIVAHKPTPATP